MNIFSKLKHAQDLTDNEKILVDFIQNHPEDFIKMSSSMIASSCYVSTSSIYRLCHKLGLKGLSDLKVQISSSLNSYLQEKRNFDYDYPVKPNQTQYQITHKLKEVYEQTIISSMNLIDLEQLRLSVSLLHKAKSIDIYTSAGNIYFAENFKFQMQEIGVTINVPMEEYQQRLTASCSDSSHCAIFISVGGRGLLVDHLIRILKKNKTPIIMITAVHSEIEKHGTCTLYLSSQENHYNKISSFATRLSLLYILDSIYTCYFELDYANNVKKKLGYYNVLRYGNKDEKYEEE